MGRNKYPEQTLEKIIITAARLFMEKGYEQTSIQDILDATELSKGGLYHHFRSKDEILEAVMQKRVQYVGSIFHDIIRDTKADNAREKLKSILAQISTDTKTHTLDMALTSHIDPHFVVNGMQSCMQQDAPIISRLIMEGIEDGSLQCEQPALCAEVFLLLMNYWANPTLFQRTSAETEERLHYLQYIMRQLGLDILDDDMIQQIISIYA